MSPPFRLFLAVVTGVTLPCSSQGQGTWQAAEPAYRWSFPRDHWIHPTYRTEWWYVTGIVADTTDPARQFGYQFRRAVTGDAVQVVAGNFAVNELIIYRRYPGQYQLFAGIKFEVLGNQ